MTSEPDQPSPQPKKKKNTATTDHDSPWKEALEYYFQDFLELLFPEIAQAINWQHPPEFLDKELQKIVNQSPEGRQYADKLVKVQLNDGQETWLLIHVEVQGEPETAFELRMYTYYHRILSRYKIEASQPGGTGRH